MCVRLSLPNSIKSLGKMGFWDDEIFEKQGLGKWDFGKWDFGKMRFGKNGILGNFGYGQMRFGKWDYGIWAWETCTLGFMGKGKFG